jgi:N-acetylmuramoyl-L-alanine amidase
MRWNSPRVGAMAVLLLCAVLFWLGAARHGVAAAGSPQEPVQTPAQPRPRPEFLVILDASHGGDDKGATLGDKVLEKDLTLALARELKVELEERGVSVRMLRDADVSLSLERRAEVANEARPSLYVALHAGVPGQGARVYAPALPMSPAPVGPFIPWESAQTASIAQSKTAARIVTEEIRKTGMNVRAMTTPLRPLNNLTAPAIAVELATGPQPWKPQQVQRLEGALASSIAAGIMQARNQIGARP